MLSPKLDFQLRIAFMILAAIVAVALIILIIYLAILPSKKENFSVYSSDEPFLLRDVGGYKNLHYNPTSIYRKIDTMNADDPIDNQVGYLNYRGRPHGIA